jgi:hypothetical protein
MARSKRKKTAGEKRAKRERKEKFMTVFMNGKQKRVPRPQLIEGLPVDEFIARNADPMWLHQNELWELIPLDDEIGESDDGLQENEQYDFMPPDDEPEWSIDWLQERQLGDFMSSEEAAQRFEEWLRESELPEFMTSDEKY